MRCTWIRVKAAFWWNTCSSETGTCEFQSTRWSIDCSGTLVLAWGICTHVSHASFLFNILQSFQVYKTYFGRCLSLFVCRFPETIWNYLLISGNYLLIWGNYLQNLAHKRLRHLPKIKWKREMAATTAKLFAICFPFKKHNIHMDILELQRFPDSTWYRL